MDAGLDPGIDPVGRGRAAGADVGVLDARDDAELAVAPLEAQRALDQHQVAPGLAAGLHPHAGVMRLAALRIVLGIVDLVDRRGLAGIGRGREGVVDIAAFLAQHDQLVVHAAAEAVRVRVVQRPVAVDEGPARLLRHRIDRQRVVAVDQGAGEAAQLLAQAGFGVLVMVQMDLDLAVAHAADLHQCIEVLGAVLLFRVEEAVDRAATVGVAELVAQRRVLLAPACHPTAFGGVVRLLPHRLVVVDEAEHHMLRGARWHRGAPVLLEVAEQPFLDVALADEQHDRGAQQQQEHDKHMDERHRSLGGIKDGVDRV